MSRYDILRPCSQKHRDYIAVENKNAGNRRIDITTRILGIHVRERIDREIVLKNNKNNLAVYFGA